MSTSNPAGPVDGSGAAAKKTRVGRIKFRFELPASHELPEQREQFPARQVATAAALGVAAFVYLVLVLPGPGPDPPDPLPVDTAKLTAVPLLEIPSCRPAANEVSEGPVRALAFDRDSTRLAVGSEDGHLRLLRVPASGSPAGTGPGVIPELSHPGEDEPPRPIRAVAVDGRGAATYVAAGGLDGSLRVWSVRDDVPDSPVELAGAHTGGVNALAFRPRVGDRPTDGEVELVSGGSDGAVRSWVAPKLAARKIRIAPGPARVHAVAFSPDGDLLAAGTSRGTIVLHFESGTACRPLDPGGNVRSVSFGRRKGRLWLAAGNASGDVAVWSWRETASRPRGDAQQDFLQRCEAVHAAGARRSWNAHESSVNSLVFTANGLASASSDHTIKLWGLDRPGDPARIAGGLHDSWVWSIALRRSDEGDAVVTGSQDRTVRLWTAPSP